MRGRPVDSPHKGPVKRKCFVLMTSSCVMSTLQKTCTFRFTVIDLGPGLLGKCNTKPHIYKNVWNWLLNQVNKDFLTWVRIGCWLCCQPIAIHVRKPLLINMDVFSNPGPCVANITCPRCRWWRSTARQPSVLLKQPATRHRYVYGLCYMMLFAVIYSAVPL